MKHVWLRLYDEVWEKISPATFVPQRLRIARHTEGPVWQETRLLRRMIIDEIQERW